MKYIRPVISIFCLLGILFAVVPEGKAQKKTEKNTDNLQTVNIGGIVRQIRPEEENYKGSRYYDDQWRKGSLLLSAGNVMKEQRFRYDLKSQKLEMVLPDSEEPKLVNKGLVKSFTWVDENGEERTFIDPILSGLPKNPALRGFLEVVYAGENNVGIYEHHSVFIQESTYTPGITVGKQTKSWVKRSSLWLYINGKYQEIPNGRRRIESMMEEEGLDINKCNIKDFDYKEKAGLKEYMKCLLAK